MGPLMALGLIGYWTTIKGVLGFACIILGLLEESDILNNQ